MSFLGKCFIILDEIWRQLAAVRKGVCLIKYRTDDGVNG